MGDILGLHIALVHSGGGARPSLSTPAPLKLGSGCAYGYGDADDGVGSAGLAARDEGESGCVDVLLAYTRGAFMR